MKEIESELIASEADSIETDGKLIDSKWGW